jgi:hypothetical protein
MVELSTTRIFNASDPVEALKYDTKQCQLIISSQHGNYAMYEVERNGMFSFLLILN